MYVSGKYLTELNNHPSIHISGSIRGMKKLGFLEKHDLIAKYGSYYYNLSIWLH